MEYEATGYNKKTYYFVNATLDNETDLVNLYLTPNSTLVTFTVTDQDDNDIQNSYIHVLKYSLPTNSYTTNEILRTDEFGEAIGSIVLTNQWYKFLIVYNGITYLETEAVKITSTTRNFRINLLTDFSSFYDIVNEITTSLIFTNSTKNFAYTFINPTGNSVEACLNVTKRSAYGDFYIGGSCSTAASGTLLVNIGNVTDGLYIASGTIHINPFFLTDVLSVNYDLGYKTLGKDGIFFSFLLRVVFAMIGIWNPIVAIVLVGLVDVVMVSMGLFYMTWEVMVVYLLLIGLTIYRLNRK